MGQKAKMGKAFIDDVSSVYGIAVVHNDSNRNLGLVIRNCSWDAPSPKWNIASRPSVRHDLLNYTSFVFVLNSWLSVYRSQISRDR